MDPDQFLAAHPDPRSWDLSDGELDVGAETGPASAVVPDQLFLGRGQHPLEVATARAPRRPQAAAVRSLWRRRQRNRPSPLLLVVTYPQDGGHRVAVCGPAGDEPPVRSNLELSQVERLCTAALAEPSRHGAVRLLTATLPEVESELPGVHNFGMFATHELREGVPLRADWSASCDQGRGLLKLRGRDLVEELGYEIEDHTVTASVLRIAGAKRAIAVFLQENEGFESAGDRFQATSPVTHALAVADREGLPWVVLTRANQIRVYSAKPDLGVGRKGRAETFVELNLSLLTQEQAGYLPLLAGAAALADGGSFTQILNSSGDYAAALGARLRDRVYVEAVPALATALARRQPDFDLDDIYEQALIVLFRLLFVAYGEDKDLLPYRSNGRYQHQALKTMARDLAEARRLGQVAHDEGATDFWAQVTGLWDAVNVGNRDWGVPAYDGGLFSEDPDVNPSGAALAELELTNAEVGPALSALLVDEGADGVIGPVDFRNLTVREFGTIYEGLLESSLSYAQTDLTVAPDGAYIPARQSDEVEVAEGDVYFHNRSGARKATGSYFTKPFAVEHLLDAALEPALDAHLRRLEPLAKAGDEAAAAEAFFDFRCADIAMGSGHFLVAAVDRIEARLSAFLAMQPIPAVTAELETLRSAALEHLGDLADGVEIEQASLLRRQVARRCVYGVDRNRIAVDLARLGLWIHTFVPGLPLSFLDHTLQVGDSLTGIGTIEEATEFLDPSRADGQLSVFREPMLAFMEGANSHLQRLATIAESTTADIEAAREADAEAREAVKPLLDAFDLILTARLGEASPPDELNETALAAHPDIEAAREWGEELGALHFPVAFPEVFLRDPAGFDCIIGNPPWEEATVEKLGFYALREPGLRGLPAAQQRREVSRIEEARPDLAQEYDDAVAEAEHLRKLLLAGPYPGMGTGDPDLYKAFCWRFWHLLRDGGAIGVVLPRSALSVAGSQPWRETVLERGAFADVTFLLNTRGWVFDDAEPRYTIALTGIRKGEEYAGAVRVRGPYANKAVFDKGLHEKPAELPAADIRSWSQTSSFPLLPSTQAGEVFVKLRAHPRLDSDEHPWTALPVAELHATNDKSHMVLDSDGAGVWPVYKGASFDLWTPDTGSYYAWADPDYISRMLQARRERQHRNRRSAFSHFATEWIADPDTLPCKHARIAFRDITRATDTRTTRVSLIPPSVVITNKGPYLVWPRGDERDQAYLLGVLSSIPLDWCARRVVEISMNFYLFNALPIPNPEPEDPLRERVIDIAGRLAAADERFADWAAKVGVPVGSVTAEATISLVAELDAAVALLYGLEPSDVRHVFDTFHEGWDPAERRDLVLTHYERFRGESR